MKLKFTTNMRRKLIRMACLTMAVLMLLGCSGCGSSADQEDYITCLDDMMDRELVIGYPDDLVLNDQILAVCPQAVLEPQNDLCAIDSVSSGKLDCYIAGEDTLTNYLEAHPEADLTILEEPLTVLSSALGLCESTPITDYVERVNECMAQLKESGVLDDMERRWIQGESEVMPEIELPEDPSYTLRVATYGQQKPNTYIKDDQLVGYDVELAYRVAAYLGCGIEFEMASFPAMLMGIAEDKYDMIASNLYITEERQENMTFADACLENPISVLVRKAPEPEVIGYQSVGDLTGTETFGNVTGFVFDSLTLEYFPEAHVEQYNSLMDEVVALLSGKIDALLYDLPTLQYLAAVNPEVRLLPELLWEEEYHVMSAKSAEGEALMEEFNAWLAEIEEDGTLEEMISFWTGAEDPEGRIDWEAVRNADYSSSKGVLRVGFSVGSRPDCSLYEGNPSGFPVELGLRFCLENGYQPEFVETKSDAFTTVLETGKVDLFVGMFSYTEERAEAVTFSDVYMVGGVAVLVRNEGVSEENFWTNFADGFRKTFVEENRWKMILSGFGNTLLISVGGFALANVLGACFCALSLSKHRFCHILEDIYSKIMQGTPIVVVLMVLYYVIFGKTRLSGELVAILSFGLANGAGLAQLFYGGITSVDKGQWEASLALGFTKTQTFFGVVMPQTVRRILPGYFSSFISLLKGTSVVGYIAVIDLTKASDIIRSGTFEAFFPLISVAVIYFVTVCLLLSCMKRIQKKLEPKRRKAAPAYPEEVNS